MRIGNATALRRNLAVQRLAGRTEASGFQRGGDGLNAPQRRAKKFSRDGLVAFLMTRPATRSDNTSTMI
jgi:hypothetical protein